MSQRILFFDSDKNWSDQIQSFLIERKFDLVVAKDDKDLNLKMYKDFAYNVLLLDISNPKRSLIETIRFLKLNAPSIKIILTANTDEVLKKLGLNEKSLETLGVEDFVIKPYKKEKLLEAIVGGKEFNAWQIATNADSAEEVNEEVIVRKTDDSFTGIKIENYFSGSVNIFDLHIRMSKDCYKKILSKGKRFNKDKITKLSQEDKIEYLYFNTSDRGAYINFTNRLIEKMIERNISTERKVSLIKDVSESLVDEVFTKGLDPQIVKEGEAVCRNIYNLVKRDEILSELLENYINLDRSFKSHVFGTTFLASIICRNVEWSSDSTVEKVCLGAMLHDLGKLKLPKEFFTLQEEDMNHDELVEYKKHPMFAMEMLKKYPTIPEAVRQIIYQHHEMYDGKGFPNGLSGVRIYPLARIVALANNFANFMVNNNYSPKQAINEFALDRKIIIKFDLTLIKSLIMGFIKKRKNK